MQTCQVESVPTSRGDRGESILLLYAQDTPTIVASGTVDAMGDYTPTPRTVLSIRKEWCEVATQEVALLGGPPTGPAAA